MITNSYLNEKASHMKKKILILNGSPRKNGNTAALIDRFIDGAQKVGHDITRFNIQQMNIHPCIGCLKGGKDPNSPCTQKDDMDKIYKAFKECDLVVLASPMYYWSFTAQLKAVLDRLFAVAEEFKAMPKKDCMMIIAAEDDSESNKAPLFSYYGLLMNALNWNDKGSLIAGGVYEVGDITGKPTLDEAYRMGIEYK